ncbi:MAG: hypothetical protein ACYC09_10690 [Bacteroidota bacterium]
MFFGIVVTAVAGFSGNKSAALQHRQAGIFRVRRINLRSAAKMKAISALGENDRVMHTLFAQS